MDGWIIKYIKICP